MLVKRAVFPNYPVCFLEMLQELSKGCWLEPLNCEYDFEITWIQKNFRWLLNGEVNLLLPPSKQLLLFLGELKTNIILQKLFFILIDWELVGQRVLNFQLHIFQYYYNNFHYSVKYQNGLMFIRIDSELLN